MIGSVFLSGICMATFAFSGIFFLKFWKASHDRFFLFFSLACGLLAAERVVLLFMSDQYSPNYSIEHNPWIYVIRVMAFGLILTAIVEKNRSKPKV
jgi:hypothetical protein